MFRSVLSFRLSSTLRGAKSLAEFSMIILITALTRATVPHSAGHVNQIPSWSSKIIFAGRSSAERHVCTRRTALVKHVLTSALYSGSSRPSSDSTRG